MYVLYVIVHLLAKFTAHEQWWNVSRIF